ncbi:MAG: MaoC family dehydratase [Polymorphobacter sp.]|uniref:MaoC family dehydratase n=1 Tax=Polymorphobacter sp. TaxID=1909290 RepID=UPI003A85D8F7
MRSGAIEIGPQRYRESHGRWFEEFHVGDVYEHRPGRTISEADNSWFTLLTMNTHPLHFDHEYAARTEFGRPLVNSTLTLAILVGMSVSDVSQKAVANLGWTAIRMTAPVFAGDTLYAESEVTALRPSGSRPEQGLVSVTTRGHNQAGVLVCDFERTMLVWKRGFGPDASEGGRA